ncbi:MAG: precorrin-2 C(20)-methyltransferase, partial [Desulfovibrio sp.]|nr:precorrin-2 C(20)-methyltransferase [Desulfovibrio sp.]
TVRALAPETPGDVIPGITSFQAAAARTEIILCEGEQSLRILPGIRCGKDLAAELAGADMAVILKAYRNFPAIARALAATGRAEDALLASHVERPEEALRHGVSEEDAQPPYMSLILSGPSREAAPAVDSKGGES